jgi:hypothetical protein
MTACNCIATIEADLPEHKLDVAIMWSRSANTLTARTYTGLDRRDTGKAERRSSKPRLIAHTFCPFCGHRYDPEVDAGEGE